MTNADLAAYLNRELNLSGQVAVTANVVRQWVGWDVLPRAGGRGRGRALGIQWDRSDRDLRRATRLARWRTAGVTRETAVIVHAFVEWGHPDWERVRDSLVKELLRSGGLLRGKVSTNLRFGVFDNVSAARKRAFRTQFGPLDDRLKGTQFELSAELYARLAQAMFNGEADMLKGMRLLNNKSDEIIAQPTEKISEITTLLMNALWGLLSSPEEVENAGATMIARCSNHNLRLARLFFNLSRRASSSHSLATPTNRSLTSLSRSLSMLQPEIEVGNWLIARLAVILKAVMQCQQVEGPDILGS